MHYLFKKGTFAVQECLILASDYDLEHEAINNALESEHPFD